MAALPNSPPPRLPFYLDNETSHADGKRDSSQRGSQRLSAHERGIRSIDQSDAIEKVLARPPDSWGDDTIARTRVGGGRNAYLLSLRLWYRPSAVAFRR